MDKEKTKRLPVMGKRTQTMISYSTATYKSTTPWPKDLMEFKFHERLPSVKLTDEVFATTPLTFSHAAWSHLCALRNFGSTEVTAYGLCLDPEKPFYVDQLIVPRQECSMTEANITGEALDEMWDEVRTAYPTLHPYQMNSIWIHTHPGPGCEPSATDMEEFTSRSVATHLAMVIVASKGNSYCLVKTKALDFPLRMRIQVDSSHVPGAMRPDEWRAEYDEKVTPIVYETKVAVSYPGYYDDEWPIYASPRSHMPRTPAQVYPFWKLKDEEAVDLIADLVRAAAYFVGRGSSIEDASQLVVDRFLNNLTEPQHDRDNGS